MKEDLMQFDLLQGSLRERDDAITPIAWYEGLQLLPHHFQEWDARLEGLLLRQRLWTSPYLWGIERLEIDEPALARGSLRVAAAAGCFPDGLAFAWNSARDGALEQLLPPDVELARYALAVPREDFNHNGTNIGRYRQFISSPVSDRTNRDEKAAIVRFLPNLTIRRWDPADPLYVQIPFLEVARKGDGFEATEFHPPSFRLLPDSACTAAIVRLARLVRGKAAQLGVLPLPSPLSTDFRCGLGWVLSSLVSGLPHLEAQMSGRLAHPYDVFLSLCNIAGACAPLAGKLPPHFPPYDHADPGQSLSAVAGFVESVVNGIGVDVSRWRELPFESAAGEWTNTVPPGPNSAEIVVLVVFDAKAPEAAVSSWWEHALICFADDKSRCLDARVRGLARSRRSAADFGLEPVPGYCYISIDARDDAAKGERRLVIAGANERSGLTLSRVSLMRLTA